MKKKYKTYTKLIHLNVGDTFIKEDNLYEVVSKSQWNSECRCLNLEGKYYYRTFSNYFLVEV